MVRVPVHPGQLILDEVAMRMRPLLPTAEFVKFCSERQPLGFSAVAAPA